MTPRASQTLSASSLSRSLAFVLVLSSVAFQPVLALLVPPVLACPPAPAVAASYEVARAVSPAERLLAADDAAWAAASPIEWGPAPYPTRFRALWSDAGLFLRFDATDPSPWHTMTQRDEHLWDEEVVEIFLDPDRSGRDYYELEINPANVVCDLRMISPWPDKKGDIDWNLAGLETRVVATRRRRRGRAAGRRRRSCRGRGSARSPPRPRSLCRRSPATPGASTSSASSGRAGRQSPEKDAVFAAWSPPSVKSFHDAGAFRDLVFRGPAR